MRRAATCRRSVIRSGAVGWITPLRVLRSDSVGGVVARRLIPAAILLPLALAVVRIIAIRSGTIEVETGIVLVTALNIVVLVALILAIATVLDRSDRSRRAAEKELRELNESLEARVRERTAELEAANRELEAFVFAVSHDLTGPLRSMRGFVHLIERHSAGLDDDGRKYLALLRQGTEEMARLIGAMLDLSTITRTDIARERVDLSALATEVIADLRRADPQRSVVVEIEPGLSVRADPALTRAALTNLIGNAWKFTARRDRARIEVKRMGPRSHTFYVRDNGAGFDADEAEHLFAPFQRLHSPDDFPGTGIGLATVQRVVRRHGGHVWAEGKVGEGATFYFTLEP